MEANSSVLFTRNLENRRPHSLWAPAAWREEYKFPLRFRTIHVRNADILVRQTTFLLDHGLGNPAQAEFIPGPLPEMFNAHGPKWLVSHLRYKPSSVRSTCLKETAKSQLCNHGSVTVTV
jgi:hypothetical protein